MKKKLVIITGSIIGIILIGLVVAGNYFYAQGVKRGTEVELHREAEVVNAVATKRDQELLAEAEDWFDKQKPENIHIRSFDGLKLQAQYIKNEADSGKTVILVHGFRNTGSDMGKLAKFYYDQGFHILLPDARGHGDSEGDYIGYGWHDRLDIVDWTKLMIDKYGSENILLHGNSMGAATVLMTSGEKLPNEVKGIIADSGYSSVKGELAHQLKYIYKLPSFPLLDVTSVITKVRAGYTFEEASAIDQVKKNTRPLFIIHGDADDLVPTEMAHEIYEAAGGYKELWIVPDAGHTKAFDNVTKAFEQRVQDFINKALKK